MTKAESRILAEVLVALSEAFPDGIFWRQNAGKVLSAAGHWIGLGPVGIADVVGFVQTQWGAQIVFVETKTLKGTLRESQKRFRSAVENKGGIYVVARSATQAVESLNEKLKGCSDNLR